MTLFNYRIKTHYEFVLIWKIITTSRILLET